MHKILLTIKIRTAPQREHSETCRVQGLLREKSNEHQALTVKPHPCLTGRTPWPHCFGRKVVCIYTFLCIRIRINKNGFCQESLDST